MQIPGQPPPSIPFHVARAYGSGKPVLRGPFELPSIARPTGAEASKGGGRAGESGASGEATGAGLNRLVAGAVPGGVDFSAPAPEAGAGVLPFYRHPADRNAAAVVMDLGRRVDVQG